MSARDNLITWIRVRVQYSKRAEVEALVDTVIAEEREACAQVADRVADSKEAFIVVAARTIAQAIRDGR